MLNRIISPKSLANLRPAKKGEVRNPGGRPKRVKCIADILWRISKRTVSDNELIPEVLKQKLLNVNPNISHVEAMLEIVYVYAFKGESWAVQFIADRMEGRVEIQPEQEDDEKQNAIVSLCKAADAITRIDSATD